MTPKASIAVTGPRALNRSCGSCTACCTQVPVDLPMGKKPANVRCPAQRSTGCAVYATRPRPCREWSCRWLFDADTAAIGRPDKSGVIIDCMPDTVLFNERPASALQLWVDPKRSDAYRAAPVRDFIQFAAITYGMLTIVRWSSQEGVAVFAPEVTGAGFVERRQALNTVEEMRALLAAARSGEIE